MVAESPREEGVRLHLVPDDGEQRETQGRTRINGRVSTGSAERRKSAVAPPSDNSHGS